MHIAPRSGPRRAERFVARRGLRRTDERFWLVLDWLHADLARSSSN